MKKEKSHFFSDLWKSNSSDVLIIGAALLLFLLFLLVMWMVGLFNFKDTKDSATIIAAALALVGALFGSLVTLVGLFLKISFDKRTLDLKNQAEERLKIESDRNINLREESEKRLKLEAAIQAVKLMSTESGKEVTIAQRAGALFVLVHLGNLEIALMMLNQLLFEKNIDACSASIIINEALESTDKRLQLTASSVINTHYAEFLCDKGQFWWPKCVEFKWDLKLLPNKIVRQELALALLNIAKERFYKYWDTEVFTEIVVTLVEIWKNEPIRELRNGVGLCLEKLIKVYEDRFKLDAPSGDISIADLRTQLEKNEDRETYLSLEKICESLDVWTENAEEKLNN